ncbi:hypothetical protein DFJ77DRAFT_542402 [Powellomyces hirtus]|nr:hypothetical protein DFJ77DRAFT_542402 [Powellomyces hirtus]
MPGPSTSVRVLTPSDLWVQIKDVLYELPWEKYNELQDKLYCSGIAQDTAWRLDESWKYDVQMIEVIMGMQIWNDTTARFLLDGFYWRNRDSNQAPLPWKVEGHIITSGFHQPADPPSVHASSMCHFQAFEDKRFRHRRVDGDGRAGGARFSNAESFAAVESTVILGEGTLESFSSSRLFLGSGEATLSLSTDSGTNLRPVFGKLVIVIKIIIDVLLDCVEYPFPRFLRTEWEMKRKRNTNQHSKVAGKKLRIQMPCTGKQNQGIRCGDPPSAYGDAQSTGSIVLLRGSHFVDVEWSYTPKSHHPRLPTASEGLAASTCQPVSADVLGGQRRILVPSAFDRGSHFVAFRPTWTVNARPSGFHPTPQQWESTRQNPV